MNQIQFANRQRFPQPGSKRSGPSYDFEITEILATCPTSGQTLFVFLLQRVGEVRCPDTLCTGFFSESGYSLSYVEERVDDRNMKEVIETT